MPQIAKLFVLLGALAFAAAVAIGAFGAHGLKERMSPEMLAIYRTGVEYHFYHAIGLLAVGLLAAHLPDSTTLRWAGWLLVAGILLFSGALYALALSGIRTFGAIAPIGGSALLAAWVLVAISVWRAY